MPKKVTIVPIRQEFQQIVLLEKELKKIADIPKYERQYLRKSEALQKRLAKLCYQDFSSLHSKELLTLCAYVHRYNPLQPWYFLMFCDIYSRL